MQMLMEMHLYLFMYLFMHKFLFSRFAYTRTFTFSPVRQHLRISLKKKPLTDEGRCLPAGTDLFPVTPFPVATKA